LNKKLLALYGLKFNPFAPDIPVEALQMTPRTESFCWRVEQLVGEGGFAVVTGAPGVGKSVTLRMLAERLSGLRDVQVGVLSRPQRDWPTSTARWASCSASSFIRTIDITVRNCCARVGRAYRCLAVSSGVDRR